VPRHQERAGVELFLRLAGELADRLEDAQCAAGIEADAERRLAGSGEAHEARALADSLAAKLGQLCGEDTLGAARGGRVPALERHGAAHGTLGALMSKAFTSEETEDPGPVGRAPPRAGETRPITREGKRALEAGLRELQSTRAALGAGLQDLSAIELAARKEELERKEELLSAILATVIEVATPADRTRVSFGCTVTVEDERGKKRRYTLVGPDETDAKAGRISAASPLGRALLEQKVGDEVELERPRGNELITVRAIKV